MVENPSLEQILSMLYFHCPKRSDDNDDEDFVAALSTSGCHPFSAPLVLPMKTRGVPVAVDKEVLVDV